MVNYELGKIYKIVCNETKLIYIGSTAQKYLSTRLEGHKRSYKSHLDGKYPYVTSFEILKGCNFDIILLENCSCKDKYEMKARERYYIETLKCVNKAIPNRTIKEYYLDKRDKRIEQVKQYYSKNKESINEQKKEYRETNKEKIQEHSRQYYLDNKDKIKEQKKEYYLKKKAEKQKVITE
jgi:hypothetical protein